MVDILGFLRSHRSWWLFAAPVLMLVWFLKVDPDHGPQLLTQLQSYVSPFLALTFAYLGRKALIRGDAKDAWDKARDGSLPNAVLVLSVAILSAVLFFGFSLRAMSAPLPPGAVQHLPTLSAEIDARWQHLPLRSALAAQIEQESNWKTHAELKTSREYGFGLGQFTRAYKADGSVRFDAWREMRASDPSLRGWTWAKRFDPTYQLRAVVLKNRGNYAKLRPGAQDGYNALAMADAAYNCGLGCVQARRRLCAQVPGCDPRQWFGHVALRSTQSKAKWHGYGLSAHDITNQHVKNAMVVRRPKYAAYFKEA